LSIIHSSLADFEVLIAPKQTDSQKNLSKMLVVDSTEKGAEETRTQYALQ